MKKLLLLFVILTLILSINIAFAENETDVYVSNEGSDSVGDGSLEMPYQTLNYTIKIATNNSNIYIKSGTYNSTGYEIVNKSVSITGIGEVVIDGKNGELSQNIFKINNGSSLTLNNIKFINGRADFNGPLSPIVNEGELYINNCGFSNFTTINGAIKNDNYVHLNNISTNNLVVDWDAIYGHGTLGYELWVISELQNPPRGELITNAANCLITNSNIISTVYNGFNMTIDNSEVKYFVSNKKFSDNPTFSYFNNSNIYTLRIANSTSVIFNNSNIFHENYHELSSSNFYFENTEVSLKKYHDNNKYYLNFGDSNVTAIGSVFNDDLHFGSGIVNITYSTLLGHVAFGYDGVYDLNYNWWGNNKGPRFTNNNEYSKVYANEWIVMTFNKVSSSSFSVDLTKYTFGGNVYNLSDTSKLPSRLVKFESESGKFSKTNGYLVNSTFTTKFLKENPDTILYATVDNQILRLVIGSGISDYKIYVSDSEGNDYYNDGSYESPYKTLKKALSQAFSGNTIYVMSGYYTLSWNSDLLISKNLTFSGIGDVTLARATGRYIFIVDDKGVLNLENINFTTAVSSNSYDWEYNNPFIELNKGNLNVKNCNFKDIASQAVIIVKNNDYVKLDNVTFDNIKGPAILGFSANLQVYNSKFSHGAIRILPSKYYGNPNPDTAYSRPYQLNFYITLTGTITMVNTTFSENTAGAVGFYTTSIYEDFWNLELGVHRTYEAYIYNSTFVNNRWDCDIDKNLDFGLAIGNSTYHTGYSEIENCTFLNNAGHIMFATSINNSRFINNSAIPYLLRTDADLESSGPTYYPSCLIQADSITNSYFYGNTYLSRKYEEMIVNAKEVYSSVFIKNRAAYGAAISNCNEVHYCVFINNSATYGGDDIFLYSGTLNASSNWWGSNQKPDKSRVQVFLGELIIDDWVIMSITQEGDLIKASLDNLLDNNKNIYKLNHTLPSRHVEFSTEGGSLTPQNGSLVNNEAVTKLVKNTTRDFDVYAQIDNQKISLTVYNNSTLILVENMTYYGKNNRFNMTLINVNGHKISNQLLNVVVRNSTGVRETFTLTTDGAGFTSLDVDYPVGEYTVDIDYYGNGYFEKSYSQAIIKVLSISTRLVSHNYTYYGKNNKFYAILADRYGKYIANQTLVLKIYNSKGKLISTAEAKTSSNGRADVLLSLDTGSYKLVWDYLGNDWYLKSHSESFITVKPINTTIELQNATFYGRGNDYELTFRDAYGTLISDETITLIISNGTDSNQFKLKTEKGSASININLLPGVYEVEAVFAGDEIYGASNANSILNIEPVFINLDYSSRVSIPENGIFTVILKDMYGNKVKGENVSLELGYKTFNKKYEAITDGSGEANFKIDVSENTYFALIDYGGSTWYKSATGASLITVSHDVVLNNVYLNGSDFTAYYGENKYYTILFNDSNAYSLEGKIVSVIISSGEWSKAFDIESDVFGNVRLQITLDPGNYNISYKYQNAYYNLHAFGSSSIDIFEMPTSLMASDLIVKKGDLRNFEVKLVDKNGVAISNLPVTINIDGKLSNVSTNSFGVAKILLDLDLGYHNVVCSFEDVNYVKSSCNATILVVDDSKTVTSIESTQLHARQGDEYNYSVVLLDSLDNPIKSSQIILNIFDLENNLIFNDTAYTNNDGLVVFSLNLTYGDYLAKTYYKGNDFYFETFNTNKIYIKPLENVTETIFFASDVDIVNGYNDKYYVILNTVDMEAVVDASVEFIVKGQSYFASTDEFGRAYLDAVFSPGAYEVKCKFYGSNNLTRASCVNYIRVSGELLYMFSSDVVKSFNNGTHYYVALFDVLGQPLAGKTIRFNIGNETFENMTDGDGLACFEVWLAPGTYNISAEYQGNYIDEYIIVNNNITVLTTLVSENITKYYGGATLMAAAFSNFNNEALANSSVVFNIAGVNYKVTTDENGIAILNIDLNPDNYVLTVFNTLTGQKELYGVNVLSTLETNDLVKYYKSSAKFTATFKDENGDLLKNTNVKFTVNGKTYTTKTTNNGLASFNVNLKPGKYTITTLNTKTGEKHTNQLTIKKTIITKNIKIKANKKINFQAKILKSNGKIAKKTTIKFKINKKTYKIKTNNKGIAKLNIKLKKGKYTITTTYNGLNVKNTVRCI